MKKLLCTLSVFVLLLCALVSCGDNEPEIAVDNDGYVIVNGVKTEHKIHTTDEITVNADGYVVVNGVATNIVADKDDVITVDNDGYVIVNGVKTEYVISSDASPKIHYPSLSYGIKIESLPVAQQQKIDEYVFDCQNLFTASYVQSLNAWDYALLGEPYISFTDTFVYDFSRVNESNLDKITSKMWNDIKALNGGESTPIMYIELSGFSNLWGDTYKPTSIVENNIIYGYFIFENETIKPLLYKRICDRYYYYKMPDGTELINCGNKYSGEKRMEVLVDLYKAIQDGLLPSDVLKRLTLVN